MALAEASDWLIHHLFVRPLGKTGKIVENLGASIRHGVLEPPLLSC